MSPPQALDFACRQEAAEPVWQDAFAQAIETKRHFLCGHCAGLGLRLFPVHLVDEGGYHVRCAPFELERHLEDCWVHTEGRLFGPLAERQVRYLPSIFDSPTAGVGLLGIGGRQSVARDYWYAGMTHFANAALMRAMLEAFAAANRGLAYDSPFLTNPLSTEILERFRLALREPLLVGGTSPLTAAKTGGLCLWMGITTANLGEQLTMLITNGGQLEIVFDELWDPSGPTMRSHRFSIAPEVARCAGGRTRAYNNYIPGPYLVFFSARDHKIVRMSVWPIVRAGGSLMTADSALEQDFLRWAGERYAVVKLGLNMSLSPLGTQLWPFNAVFPHRADGIVFTGDNVRIVEVVGSQRPGYLSAVELRLAAYRKRFAHASVEVVTVKRSDLGNLNW